MLVLCVGVGCATPSDAPVVSQPGATDGSACQSIGMLVNNGEQIATAFKIRNKDQTYYLTAAHVFSEKSKASAKLVFNCKGVVDVVKVIDFKKIPNIDVAAFSPEKDINRMPVMATEPPKVGKISIPNFSSFTDIDPRLSGVLFNSYGDMVKVDGDMIYFSANIIRAGASGAPVINDRGAVVGVLSGRFLEKGGYFSGVGYGISMEQVLKYLSAGIADNSVDGVR